MNFKDWLDLNEIFDSPVPWKWTKQSKNEFEASFEINNKKFSVGLGTDFFNDSSNNEWYLSFSQDYPTFSTGITNSGDAGQVLSTVMSIVRDFENKVKPQRIFFTSEGRSRRNLYQKMLQRYLPSNYTKTVSGTRYQANFDIERGST